jgi:hypothetical protein
MAELRPFPSAGPNRLWPTLGPEPSPNSKLRHSPRRSGRHGQRRIRLRRRRRLVILHVGHLPLRIDHAGGQVLQEGRDSLLYPATFYRLSPLADDELNLARHPARRRVPAGTVMVEDRPCMVPAALPGLAHDARNRPADLRGCQRFVLPLPARGSVAAFLTPAATASSGWANVSADR